MCVPVCVSVLHRKKVINFVNTTVKTGSTWITVVLFVDTRRSLPANFIHDAFFTDDLVSG